MKPSSRHRQKGLKWEILGQNIKKTTGKKYSYGYKNLMLIIHSKAGGISIVLDVKDFKTAEQIAKLLEKS